MSDRIRAVHLNVLPDPLRRPPDALLEAWFTLADVAAAAAAAGVEVTVVQAAVYDDELERDGVRYRFVRARLPSRMRRALGAWATPLSRGVLDAVADLAPDVVHFHGLSFPRHVGAIVGALPRTPVLLQDHADGVARPGRRALYRRGFAGVAAVAFTSAVEAERFLDAGVLPRDVTVFALPESSSRFTPGDQGVARVATGLQGDPCLLWIGHLDANKDPLTMLDAVAMASEELSDLRLWCVYRTAPLLAEVKARIAGDPRLVDRVRLLGPRPPAAIETHLRAADLLVLSSRREGSCFSVMEALACGIPPVVSDIPSLRGLTGDGAVGAHFAPGDARAAAAAIVRLAKSDRAALGVETRAHFERELSFEVLGGKLAAAYRSLVSRST